MTTDYENFLKDWIMGFLSTPLPLLNGFPPCPYAKKAIIDDKVLFFRSENYEADITALFNNWDDKYDVAVCVAPDDVDSKDFVEATQRLNDAFLSKGFGCLEDHKDIPEKFYEYSFNNGRYNIILCQRMEKINSAAHTLRSKGYYRNWPTELYNEVVSWRDESLRQRRL